MELTRLGYLYFQIALLKSVQWSEEGMSASYKFLQKLWNLDNKIKNEIKKKIHAKQ